MYLTCDLPAPPLYPDEMRENIIPQVPLFTILNKFNGVAEKEYKTYKDSTLKRFEITQLPPFIILYIKVNCVVVGGTGGLGAGTVMIKDQRKGTKHTRSRH